MERVAHEPLEGGRGIGETEEHYCGFKQPLMGNKGGLPLMVILDPYIIVPPLHIELGKDFGIL